MDLWIRSQDRRILSKVSYLQEHFGNGKYGVYDEAIPMGYYETEERALEVLDEIQNYLKPKIIISKTGEPLRTLDEKTVYINQEKETKYQALSTFVYRMPKE